MMPVTPKILRKRRSIAVVSSLLMLIVLQALWVNSYSNQTPKDVLSVTKESANSTQPRAIVILEEISAKGRAPKTGYSRSMYGDGWGKSDGCDTRNKILRRDMENEELAADGCVVLKGLLNDPYTATQISFVRGSDTSSDVQIDHVVALSDSWQKGAQLLSFEKRVEFANDPLNLLAVDGPANQQKGDSDVASWLPPNKSYRCRYVARQIAVKREYSLWVTEAEKAVMKRILSSCPDQPLPERVLYL